jgi:NhaP-type Na+/H+ or K+/H+ antiporter
VAGILAVAVVLGNAPAISRALKFESGVELEENVRGFHSQLAFVIKALFFTFVGVQAGGAWPPVVLGILLAGVVAAVRWPAIVLATRGSELSVTQKHVIWAGAPRGMATGVLALLPAGAGLWAAGEIQATAFAAIMASVVIFTVALRVARLPVATAPAARWTPAPAAMTPAQTYAPKPVAAPVPEPTHEAALVDPFKALEDLFPPIAPKPGSPDPAPWDDVKPATRDEDVKPGSGFRW